MGNGECVWEFEVEKGGDEIDHGGEVLDGAEAAGLAFDRLNDAVEGLGGTVGDSGVQVGDHAIGPIRIFVCGA